MHNDIKFVGYFEHALINYNFLKKYRLFRQIIYENFIDNKDGGGISKKF